MYHYHRSAQGFNTQSFLAFTVTIMMMSSERQLALGWLSRRNIHRPHQRRSEAVEVARKSPRLYPRFVPYLRPPSRSVLAASSMTTSSTTTSDDKRYQKRYRLQGHTTAMNPSGVTVTTHRGHTLQTDLPRSMGGQNAAAQPLELLLTALAGCTQATALFVGRHLPHRLLLERMEFDWTAVRDERGALHLPILPPPPPPPPRLDGDDDDAVLPPSRLQKVSGTVTVYAVVETTNHNHHKPVILDRETLQVWQEQTELRCPVANMMMASGCVVDVQWIDGNNNGAAAY